MAHHGSEPGVNPPLLATADLVDGRLHVVVNATLRHAAQHPESVVVSIEQHLVCLGEVGAQYKSPAMAQLEVRDLQLGVLLADGEPVFAPVELERLPRGKGERDKRPAAGPVGAFALALSPVAAKAATRS